MTDLPVACTLAPGDLAARRGGLLPGLAAWGARVEAIEGGRRWVFPFERGLLPALAAIVDAEHRCCPFLRFALTVEPGDGAVTLTVTGPEGTEAFLASLLDGPA